MDVVEAESEGFKDSDCIGVGSRSGDVEGDAFVAQVFDFFDVGAVTCDEVDGFAVEVCYDAHAIERGFPFECAFAPEGCVHDVGLCESGFEFSRVDGAHVCDGALRCLRDGDESGHAAPSPDFAGFGAGRMRDDRGERLADGKIRTGGRPCRDAEEGDLIDVFESLASKIHSERENGESRDADTSDEDSIVAPPNYASGEVLEDRLQGGRFHL